MPNDPFVDVGDLPSLGPLRYLDVRDQAAFDAGHAPGAVRCHSQAAGVGLAIVQSGRVPQGGALLMREHRYHPVFSRPQS